MKIFRKFTNQHGSTIIELLIAVMVVGLIITAVANSVTYSIKNTGESKFRQNATILGQQVLEKLRTDKNTLGMVNFKNSLTPGENCYSDIDSPSLNACGAAQVVTLGNVEYKRDVFFAIGGSGTRTPEDPYYVNVIVTVSWMDGSQTREIELIQEFKQTNGFTN